MEDLLPSQAIEFKHLMWVFGALLVGILIMRFGIKRSVKPPKGGRLFKRKFEDKD